MCTLNLPQEIILISINSFIHPFQYLFDAQAIPSLLDYNSYQFTNTPINMKLILSIIVINLILSSAAANNLQTQYVPISNRYPGIQIGPENSNVTVEMVYDPTCDGSQFLDQKIRQVIAGFDDKTQKQVTFKYALNVLPYHIASFKLAMALRYVNVNKGPAPALELLRYFLDSILLWNEDVLKTTTINEFLNKIGQHVSKTYSLDYAALRKQLDHYSVNDNETRKWAKFVMGTLRAPGTPKMYINGARVDGAMDLSIDQINSLITKLL